MRALTLFALAVVIATAAFWTITLTDPPTSVASTREVAFNPNDLLGQTVPMAPDYDAN